ncbi:hypothetical protein Y032_0352g3277 [Ancylostoma ceylanicum]|uniref:Uncharacterized protein n=1 Tax=Ancylostoma ceylanicum TaxID=53326 RepID=A0A016RWS5_9BILA|nr:hypothetical protein Y032_0352g3277 [Ancylostoma ceylanicum]
MYQAELLGPIAPTCGAFGLRHVSYSVSVRLPLPVVERGTLYCRRGSSLYHASLSIPGFGRNFFTTRTRSRPLNEDQSDTRSDSVAPSRRAFRAPILIQGRGGLTTITDEILRNRACCFEWVLSNYCHNFVVSNPRKLHATFLTFEAGLITSKRSRAASR